VAFGEQDALCLKHQVARGSAARSPLCSAHLGAHDLDPEMRRYPLGQPV